VNKLLMMGRGTIRNM